MRPRLLSRVGFLAGGLALAWGLFAGYEGWRVRGELGRARAEMDEGRLESARRRLAALAAARPGALGGAVDYWLGICETARGRPEAALRAFARVPDGFAFDPRGAYSEARANLERGRLRDAERRLVGSLARGGPGLEDVRSLLIHVYQVQVRFDDSRALLREGLGDSADEIRDLKRLSTLELGRLPYDGLGAALEEAGRLAPGDDRVWLGRGRLAILLGRFDEAEVWLRRCLGAGPDAADWRAWLDWALAAERPVEALAALRQLGSENVSPAERYAVRAWFFRQAGDPRQEGRALDQWLAIEPCEPRALERRAALAQQGGQSDRAAELRRRKAEIDRALEGYRSQMQKADPFGRPEERLELASLAESAGRPFEARILYRLCLEADPGLATARTALARLDREDADRSRASTSTGDPWADLATIVRADRDGRSTRPGAAFAFTDDAEASGLAFAYESGQTPIHQLPETFGGGLAIVDYDADGWPDVFCVQGGGFPPDPMRPNAGDRLFRNEGGGTFKDVTVSAGFDRFGRGYGHGVAVGDVDNDGFPDLFVTRWRSYALYRNKGDGTFEDATEAAGLGGDRDWPTSAAFADLDGDGDLDLYVCHYAVWDSEQPRLCRDATTGAYVGCSPLECEARPDHLFRNDGGRFTDVTAEAGIVDRDGRGLGVVAADLDGDGLVDLYIANDLSANFLFRNRGGLRFEEVGHQAGVAAGASGGYQAGMGVACGDLDGDGLDDLAVTNFFGESTTFYRNLGHGLFGDSTAAVGLAAASRPLLGFGLVLSDLDNDGRLDLASANGHVNDLRPNFPYTMPAQLLAGVAGGRLVDVTDRAGPPWRVLRMGRGLAAGDLDNDGRVDLLLLGHDEPLAYFHNRTPGGHFVTIRLEGDRSNRDAVGAAVTLRCGDRRFSARRTGGGSYQSASDPRLHFGLGDITRIDEVEVHWPSGRLDRLRDLRVDTGYLLREGRCEPDTLAGYRAE